MLTLIFSFVFILCFIWNSQTAIPETADAVRLFLFVVLPSIFPFCVLSELLTRTHVFERAGRLFAPLMRPLFGISGSGALALLIGLVGSYPTGAKTTASLYKSGAISREEALALSAFTNNAGPLFVIGVVGSTMLSSVRLGVLLWLCHIMASLLTGVLMRFGTQRHFPGDACLRRSTATPAASAVTPGTGTAISSSGSAAEDRTDSFAKILSACIADSARTMIPIAGTIIFFAALCASLHFTGNPMFEHLVSAARMLLEMTSGSKAVSELAGLGRIPIIALFAATLAWGGISVHMQILYILSESGLSCRRYLLGKAVHTILAVVLTCVVFSLTVYR